VGAWTTANADVRTFLSDGPTDKLRYRKKVMGQVDGSNTTFKTFEARRITALVGAAAPLGVYVAAPSGSPALAAVTSEDLESGEFYLTAAPAAGSSVHATYYIQWFDDTEIVQFLVSASEWITGIDDYTSIPNNQWPSAKTYAGAVAFQKLSLKFASNLAETYQLYDAPDEKRFDPIKTYAQKSTDLFKLAFELRDDTYKNRQGQALAPLFGTIRGRVKDVAPNR
jgi:hypothetical protein